MDASDHGLIVAEYSLGSHHGIFGHLDARSRHVDRVATPVGLDEEVVELEAQTRGNETLLDRPQCYRLLVRPLDTGALSRGRIEHVVQPGELPGYPKAAAHQPPAFLVRSRASSSRFTCAFCSVTSAVLLRFHAESAARRMTWQSL